MMALIHRLRWLDSAVKGAESAKAARKETPLTTDGVKDFGYATSNAGWVTSAAPSVSWAPDSKKLVTQQQDERKVGDMNLVETPVNGGHPVLRSWKYPLAGDSVVAMIHRVIIDVETGKMTRLQMPPDYHRAMTEDDIDMGEYLWSPDATRLGFGRIYPDETADSALAFLAACERFYAHHGVQIERVLTDG